MLAFRHTYSTFSTECTPFCGSFRVLASTMTVSTTVVLRWSDLLLQAFYGPIGTILLPSFRSMVSKMRSKKEEVVAIQSKLLGFTIWFRACWSLAMSCLRILESSHHTVGRFVPSRTFLTATKSEKKEDDSQVSKSTLWMDIRVEKRKSSSFQPYVQILTVSLDS